MLIRCAFIESEPPPIISNLRQHELSVRTEAYLQGSLIGLLLISFTQISWPLFAGQVAVWSWKAL